MYLKYPKLSGCMRYFSKIQFMAVVIVMTNVTAIPRPFEDFKSFDMDMKEQVPRKFVSNILLVKIEAKNNTSGLIAGALIC